MTDTREQRSLADQRRLLSIEQHKKSLTEAGPGAFVGVSIGGIPSNKKVKRGDVIYLANQENLFPVKSFRAMVCVPKHPGVLKIGYSPTIFCRTANGVCRMTKILWKRPKLTHWPNRMDSPPDLVQYETAEVEFAPQAPLFLEPCDNGRMGRLAVMDSNKLKMMGKVTSAVYVEER